MKNLSWCSLKRWLQQPTTITAISTICGTIAALSTHEISASAAIPLLFGAIIGALLPDNSNARVTAQALACDGIDLAKELAEAKTKNRT